MKLCSSMVRAYSYPGCSCRRLVTLATVALLVALSDAAASIISTSSGKVRGSCNGKVCLYQAIPYAQPPLGELRWAPPATPPASWDVIRDGTRPGKACWQTPADPSTPQSEDCLHADVYVPQQQQQQQRERSTPLPVIVMFYGGGAMAGANYWYNFTTFVSGGEAVLIVPNYRVGPLGFMATAELSATAVSGTSGNYGVMDCAAAMGWARRNAAAFGGDATRVTAAGQSSGATMIWAMLASFETTTERRRHGAAAPLLFDRAIVLSGSPNISMSLAAAERQNVLVAAHLGCGGSAHTSAAAIAACLRHNVSAARISGGDYVPLNTTWQDRDYATWGIPSPAAHRPRGYDLAGIVIVDGGFVRRPLGAALAAGAASGIDLLVANVGEESDLCPIQDFSRNGTLTQQGEVRIQEAEDWGPLVAFVGEALAPWGGSVGAQFGKDLLARYYCVPNTTTSPAAPVEQLKRKQQECPATPQQAYVQLSSHLGTSCGQLAMLSAAADAAAKLSTGTGSVRRDDSRLFYAVTATGPSRPSGQVLGIAAQPGYRSRFAYHQFDLLWAMESWNWFANFNGVPAEQLYKPTGEDRAQAALLREIWFGFAASGTAPGVPSFVATQTKVNAEVGADLYHVGLIGKRNVTAASGWQHGLCSELRAAGLWEQYWWAN